MVGINGGELLIILVLAVLLIGPERLPGYAEQLGRLVRSAKKWFDSARSRVDEELGDEVKDVDWAALDPRQYDPRRIVRDALLDPGEPAATGAAGARGRVAAAGTSTAAGAAGAAAGTSTAAGASGARPAGATARPAGPTGPTGAAGEPTPGTVVAPFDDEAT
ncbi:hypothetical protein GCM10025865_02260 [Paraoerskovia sediminicola]|uniref:Sec-independent protein translocase protein TatB n=1 Tax=Paraoerskovia sediminicola TaxID=1138587 RepID=A0ABM8FYR7_9CELL|nr:twin-arginine translocase TatA/TatE family subunit [Paraoerskovia sediminicola]BDZ40927.1 hypothetical protein GCM10025865_02260 [Paraoerskovia sediminicola]